MFSKLSQLKTIISSMYLKIYLAIYLALLIKVIKQENITKAPENEVSIEMPLTCKKQSLLLYRVFSKVQNLMKLIQKDLSQFKPKH